MYSFYKFLNTCFYISVDLNFSMLKTSSLWLLFSRCKCRNQGSNTVLSSSNLFCSPWCLSVKPFNMAVFTWAMVMKSSSHGAMLCSFMCFRGTMREAVGRDLDTAWWLLFFSGVQSLTMSTSVMSAGSRVTCIAPYFITQDCSETTACCCSKLCSTCRAS